MLHIWHMFSVSVEFLKFVYRSEFVRMHRSSVLVCCSCCDRVACLYSAYAFVHVKSLKFNFTRAKFVTNALDVFIIFAACVCIAVGVLDLFWFKTTLMFGYFLVSLLHGSES